MRYAFVGLLLLVACSKSPTTATTGFVDPTVFVVNGTTQDTATMTWAGSNYVGGTISNILPGQSVCAHFDALPDSAYFTVVFHGPENVYFGYPPAWSGTPHFDPSAHPYWAVSTTDTPDATWGAILAIPAEVASAPC